MYKRRECPLAHPSPLSAGVLPTPSFPTPQGEDRLLRNHAFLSRWAVFISASPGDRLHLFQG